MATNWNAINNRLSEAVVESGRLEELLEALGCEPQGHPGGDVFRFRCPVHGGRDLNCQARAGGHTLPVFWQCFSHNCHAELKSTLLGLVRGALTGDAGRPAPLTEARLYVEKFLGGVEVETRTVPPPVRPKPFEAGWPRERVRGWLQLPSAYFLGRGFGAEVLDRYDVGDSPKTGRAVAPIYDDYGWRCVGWVSRATDDERHRVEARWKFPFGFPKGDWLYGYAEARRSPLPYVLLVEGVPDVLRAAEAGVPAVACFGTGPSDRQLDKLAALGREVVVAFDNDDAGRAAVVPAMRDLRVAGAVASFWHPPTGFKDVAEMPVEAIPGWLEGRLAVRARPTG